MKPILFNTEMVRAILDGRKTVTRRPCKVDPYDCKEETWGTFEICEPAHGVFFSDEESFRKWLLRLCRYHPGDILYVRETWYYESHMHDRTAGKPDLSNGLYSHRYVFKASSPDYSVGIGVGQNGWRPSIHMPKSAARIFLRVTGVRVERMQEISNKDALHEGVARHGLYNEECYAGGCYNGDFESSCAKCEVPREGFSKLWNSTVKDIVRYGWNANPWVWVIEFERCEKPMEDV